MSLGMLLPLAAVAAAQPVTHHDTNLALASRLADDVRAEAAAGWTLSGYAGFEPAITMVRGKVAHRHIVEVDEDGEGGTYRIEVEAAPADVITADPGLIAMIAAPRGGVSLEPSCGDWYLSPYAVEKAAVGAAAGQLISRTLRAMNDLEGVYREDDHVVFAIERDKGPASLIVSVDDDGSVVAAELRSVEWYGGDLGSTYARTDRLARALRGHAVTALDGADALVIDGKPFEIDPHGDAYVMDPRDEEDYGCGC